MKCYLHYAGQFEKPEAFRSMGEAKDAFLQNARILARYDQKIEATLHIAPTLEQMNEYPDYVLSLTERGNLRCERA